MLWRQIDREFDLVIEGQRGHGGEHDGWGGTKAWGVDWGKWDYWESTMGEGIACTKAVRGRRVSLTGVWRYPKIWRVGSGGSALGTIPQKVVMGPALQGLLGQHSASVLYPKRRWVGQGGPEEGKQMTNYVFWEDSLPRWERISVGK